MKIKYAIGFIVILSLFGCSSVPEYKTIYDEHEKMFSASIPYVTHRIQRDEYFLHAREYGKENKGKGPGIVLMHGFPDSLHLYDRLIPYLVEKRHVIAFDFLGWGDSDKPSNNEYTSDSLKRDLEAVVQYFDMDDIVIVVHDASGPPGIDWGLENINKINSLVLLNTYYHPVSKLKPPEAIALFSTPSIKRVITTFIASISDARWQAGIIEQLDKFMSDSEVRKKYTKIFAYQALGIRQAFFGLNDVLMKEMESRKSTASKRLGGFSRPVKIVFGGDDPYLNKYVANDFQSMFPSSTLHLVENAGHYVQLDKPEEVAEYILK